MNANQDQERKPVAIVGEYVVTFESVSAYMDERNHFTGCGWTKRQVNDHMRRNYAWFDATVQLYKGGQLLAENFLGGCSYKSPDEFWSVYRNDYFADMVRECLSQVGEDGSLFPTVGIRNFLEF